jgi:hypothetical protein
MQKIFFVKSLVESKYCCNFAIEFRKRLDMSLILNRIRESSVIPCMCRLRCCVADSFSLKSFDLALMGILADSGVG